MAETRTRFANYWLEQALAEEGDSALPAPPLEGEATCDVAIVGGGYTGLWTAIELKARKPHLDVRLIEKHFCGWGASSRNAGYLLNMWAKYPTMRDLFGTERALAVGRAADAALEEVVSFCAENGIDAEIARRGWLWGATLPQTFGEWRPIVDALAPYQVNPLREISAEEIADRWGLTALHGGAIDDKAGHLQPAKLVRGLRRVAIERGVTIHEGTPMTRLHRTAPPRLETPRGSLKAQRIVLAMYAWAAQLPELRRSLAITGYANAMTPAMPERLEKSGFADAPAFNDTRFMINSLRPTAGGRVMFGKPGRALAWAGETGEAFERDTAWLLDGERRRREVDPIMPGLEAAYAWSGPIDRTRDGLPFFGRLPGAQDILYATGFSGDGVGPCRMAGKAMAAMALDEDGDWADFGLVRPPMQDLPPEPVRWIGVRAVRSALARTDDAVHAGRKPGPLTRGLAGLMSAGIASRGDA